MTKDYDECKLLVDMTKEWRPGYSWNHILRTIKASIVQQDKDYIILFIELCKVI